MMDHRKALTISLTVDKDNSTMGNPLKIPKLCLSSEYGKLEAQIHWTKIAGNEAEYHHKNGSTPLEHSHQAMVGLGLASRKPCLILTDVLKTEPGRAYLDRKRRGQILGNGEQVTSSRRERGPRREDSQICRDTRSGQREASSEGSAQTNGSATPRHNQRTPSLSSPRVKLRSRSEEDEQEEEEEEDEDEELRKVILAAQVGHRVPLCRSDWGLLENWEAAGHPAGDESPPGSDRGRGTDAGDEEQHGAKSKADPPEPQCNRTRTPKGRRGSVLCPSGEAGRDGGPARKRLCLEESEGDAGSESPNCGIVRITVVGDEGAEGGPSPITSPAPGVGETAGTLRRSLSSSQDNTVNASPSEPIVLSSDEDEEEEEEEVGGVPQHCSPVIHPLVCVGMMGTQTSPLREEDVVTQEGDSGMQLVMVEDFPGALASVFEVAFSTLHCGGYRVESNGNLMIVNQRVTIPLKDASGQGEVTLTLEPTELRKYSMWQHQELNARGLCYEGEEPPATLLLLLVSDAQAHVVQTNLRKLSAKQHRTTPTDQASPFLLLSLRDPLEGVEGAVLSSTLDIICFNRLAHEEPLVTPGNNIDIELEDIHIPLLSLEYSLELIRRTGLDPQLLSLLGQDSTDPEPDTDQCTPKLDEEDGAEPHIQLEVQPHAESIPKPHTVPEGDTELGPEPEKEEGEKEPPAEESGVEAKPIYTLCHRRTRGSYSVSLSKPDSSWTKYKHQGLARRLIQFPPPPLKGGITVTMEDLQCLDNGQFLNDVIIDFYLKYLLQKAPAAVAERSHVFSSFFYKQLTRRDNASEDSTSAFSQRQRRHQRVKTWTRHVDIFKKDFLFVPVNQEAHWYLVVICFPGLEEPRVEDWTGPGVQRGTGEGRSGDLRAQEEAQGSKKSNGVAEAPPASNPADKLDRPTESAQGDSTEQTPPGPPNCTEQTCQTGVVSKRPCILIMDSLKLSLHERVFKLLREYLQSEWEVRRSSVRDFSVEQMKGSHCRVPLQDNSSDCGLYLLQYVESFLKDPVVHFDLPLCLERWFPRQQVRRKRDEIRNLILHLYRHQALDRR
ncbi:uncharacterized protein ACJ7VT_014817 isoform 2-T2 [Polymixia lowei]